jgi:O-methyltransferase domain/Dimerisation domain
MSSDKKRNMNDEVTNKAFLPPWLVVKLVLAFRRWLVALADAMVPPQLPLFEQASGVMRTHLLGAAARLRIADLLDQGPLDAATLAARTERDPDALERMMRALCAAGVFRRTRDGRFANNRLSAALRSGRHGSFRDFVDYFGSASNLAAWTDFERTLMSGKNAFERVHGVSVWEWFDRHPDERAVFAGAMSAMTQLEAPGVARAYPFGEVRRLCDVAGSRGTLLAEVLVRHRHLRGLLFDNAGVVAGAPPLFAARGVGDRVELAAGSFFERVPEGCDAYLLKNILHDWDDARSLTILRNCRRAMQPGHRLLVVELVVEPETTDGVGPLSDVQMMMVCSEGRQRSRADFARLFDSTGFKLRRVLPTATGMSIVEGIATE